MSAKVLFQGRVLTALTMFVIFLAMSLMALGFPDKAALMPLLIGVPGTVLALVQLVLEYRTARAEVEAPPSETAAENRRSELQMYLWLVLFFIGILCFGFIYATPLLVFAFLYIGKKESLVTGVVGGVATWAVLFGFFEKWFEIQLFEGLVIEWLFM